LIFDAEGAQTPPTTVSARFNSSAKKDAPITLSLPSPQKARELLEALLPLYVLAQQTPLPFSAGAFESALKCYKQNGFPPALIPSALSDAHDHWLKGTFNSGTPDAEKPAIRYAFRGCPIPLPGNPLSNIWCGCDPSQPIAWRIIAFVQSWLKSTGFPF
jgi:exonuclease V gamma subunit